jgi:hypothetical protein
MNRSLKMMDLMIRCLRGKANQEPTVAQLLNTKTKTDLVLVEARPRSHLRFTFRLMVKTVPLHRQEVTATVTMTTNPIVYTLKTKEK